MCVGAEKAGSEYWDKTAVFPSLFVNLNVL